MVKYSENRNLLFQCSVCPPHFSYKAKWTDPLVDIFSFIVQTYENFCQYTIFNISSLSPINYPYMWKVLHKFSLSQKKWCDTKYPTISKVDKILVSENMFIVSIITMQLFKARNEKMIQYNKVSESLSHAYFSNEEFVSLWLYVQSLHLRCIVKSSDILSR